MFDRVQLRRLIETSLPLVGGSLGGLVMMVVDRVALSYASEETLVASGPAVFTAMTLITFLTGMAGITRSFVAQESGRGGAQTKQLCLTSLVFATGLGSLIVVFQAPITWIPGLSNRAPEIVALEQTYLYWACYFGLFMVVNAGLSSYFNGLGRVRIPFLVGMLGQVIDIVLTVGLVFGYWGLPRWGIKGSAVGTLVAVAVMTVVYLWLLRHELSSALRTLRADLGYYRKTLVNLVRVGLPNGLSAGLEELGTTAFVWIVGLIGMAALAANNINLIINYVMIIPVIGMGIGSSILIGQEVGRGGYDNAVRIFVNALGIELAYVIVSSALVCGLARPIVLLLTSSELSAHYVDLAVSTVYVVWTYGVAFVLSMTGSTALEAVGHTRFVVVVRVVFMWILSVPLIYYVSSSRPWGDQSLLACWLIGSAFELIIGVLYVVRFLGAIRRRDNQIELVDTQ